MVSQRRDDMWRIDLPAGTSIVGSTNDALVVYAASVWANALQNHAI